MEIKFYNCSCGKNFIRKDSYLREVIVLEGTLRDSSSVINPSITIQSDDNKILDCNYALISGLRRYYWITDITSVRKGVWRIDMHVDVLDTFYNNFSGSKTFWITRSENLGNPMIEDTNLTFEKNWDVQEFNINSGIYKNINFFASGQKVNFNIVVNGLVTDVKHSQASSTITNPFPGTQYPKEIEPKMFLGFQRANVQYLMDWGTITNSDGTTDDGYNIFSFYHALMNDYSSLSSYAKSIIAYPFSPKHYDIDVNVALGNKELKCYDGKTALKAKLMNSFSEYLVLADFVVTAKYGDFRDYSPYSKYELFIPFYGWIELDSKIVVGKRIAVYYVTNYEDGSATAFVGCFVNDQMNVIWSNQCQLGLQLSLDSTNYEQINTQRLSALISMAVGSATSVASTYAGLTIGNDMMAVGGLMGGVKTVTSGINTLMNSWVSARQSFASSANSLYSSLFVKIRYSRMKAVTEPDAKYKQLFGLPCFEYHYLNECKGFTKVGQCNLISVNYATSAEIVEIESLLANGVYIVPLDY